MKDFKWGTPAFGFFLGAVFVLCGALVMWIGFWKTLILAVLFAAGYFIGAVRDKSSFMKSTVDRVVPEGKNQTIDFRKEVEKEQASRYTQEYVDTEAETEQHSEDGE